MWHDVTDNDNDDQPPQTPAVPPPQTPAVAPQTPAVAPFPPISIKPEKVDSGYEPHATNDVITGAKTAETSTTPAATDAVTSLLLRCPHCPCRVRTLDDLAFHLQFHNIRSEVRYIYKYIVS